MARVRRRRGSPVSRARDRRRGLVRWDARLRQLADGWPRRGATRCGAAAATRRGVHRTKLWTPDAAEAGRQLDRQLAWFGGRIDLLQVHNLVGWPGRLDRLEEQRDAGRVRFVGASHYLPSAFDELERVMRTRRLDAIQVPLNPRERAVEARLLPLASDLGIGVLVMRPFGKGSLLGRPFPAVLAEAGLSGRAEALLRWVLADPRVTVVLPATRSPENAAANVLAGTSPPLDPEVRDLIGRLAA